MAKCRRLKPETIAMRKLIAAGYDADPVERRVTVTVKKDWLGFVDILAVKENLVGVLAIQVTDMTHRANRAKKVTSCPAVRHVLQAGNRVELWGVRPDGSIAALTLALFNGGFRWHNGSEVPDIDSPPRDTFNTI